MTEVRIWRAGLFSICLFASLGAGAAAQDYTHEVTPGPTAVGAVTLADMDMRWEMSAISAYQKGLQGPYQRLVEYDRVFPANAEEYRATGKLGILLLSAISRDESELPLAAAYLGGVKLKCIGSARRTVPPKSATSIVYGQFRVDSFCLIPAGIARGKVDLTVDFAKNRKGFLLAESMDPPDFVLNDPSPQTGATPNIAELRKIIDREYPGFGIQVSP